MSGKNLSEVSLYKKIEESKTEGFSEYMLDNAALQLRKMVEFLLLGISILHREAFVRSSCFYEHHCSGKSLFSNIEDLDKSFLPQALESQYKLSLKNFHNIFEICSYVLHITNPFLLKTQKNIDRKIQKIFEYSHQLIEALNHHSIKLYNGDILVYERLPNHKSAITIEEFWAAV